MQTALAITPQPFKQPIATQRPARISAKLREAIRLMVEDALTRQEAAQKAGLTDHALYSALRKPHVLAYRSSLLEALRTSEASRTIGRAAKLADKAESEHVQLQANTWLAGIAGISPIQKSESVNVHKHLMPGLTIVLGAPAEQIDGPRLIDGQVHEVENRPKINMLGTSVPHPLAGNAPK